MNKVKLCAKDGATAEIFSHGAHVCSWIPAGGEEQLFLSSISEFGENKAIRGGIPIIFPQFAGLGALPKHGFARTSQWQLLNQSFTGEGAAKAAFELRENIARLTLWPHVFRAELTITVGANHLRLDFAVINEGDTTFSFTAALHNYFCVDAIAKITVDGLGGLTYFDTVTGERLCQQDQNSLKIEGEIDRIYHHVLQPVSVVQASQSLSIAQSGFQDLVVWNPGSQKTGLMIDMEPDGYQRMICVESAAIMQPIILAPGRDWLGTQVMTYAPKPLSD